MIRAREKTKLFNFNSIQIEEQAKQTTKNVALNYAVGAGLSQVSVLLPY